MSDFGVFPAYLNIRLSSCVEDWRFCFCWQVTNLVSFRLKFLSWLMWSVALILVHFQKFLHAALCLSHSRTSQWLIWCLVRGLCNGSDLRVFALYSCFPLLMRQPCVCTLELRRVDLCIELIDCLAFSSLRVPPCFSYPLDFLFQIFD